MGKININGDIGGWGANPDYLQYMLAYDDDPQVDIHINSFGGDFFAGLAMRNMIIEENKTRPVNTHGVAYVMSAAGYMLTAGAKSTMPSNGFFMLHEPMFFTSGDADDMTASAGLLDKIANTIADMYSKKTGKTSEEIRAMMKEETYLTGKEALEAGFIDELSDEVEVVNSLKGLQTSQAVRTKLPDITNKNFNSMNTNEIKNFMKGIFGGKSDVDNAKLDEFTQLIENAVSKDFFKTAIVEVNNEMSKVFNAFKEKVETDAQEKLDAMQEKLTQVTNEMNALKTGNLGGEPGAAGGAGAGTPQNSGGAAKLEDGKLILSEGFMNKVLGDIA